VTEKDILKKVVLKELDPRTTRLEQTMSSPLVTIQADQGLGEAALMMLEKKIRRLLVVENDKIVGIITEGDLDRATLDAMMSLGGAF
jgi:CBS domain-containing protein